MRLFNVASQFQSTVLNDVLETSSIFSEKEFCIINGNNKMTKSDIELKVVENGGRIVQNPGKNTFCIIAGEKNVRVMNAIKSGEHNIATIDWFLNTLKEEYVLSGKLLEWTPRDLLGMSLTTAENFILKYDKFGDSYTIPTNRQSLEYCMNQVYEIINPIEPFPVEMNHLDFEIFNQISPYSFLRGCNIYFKDDDENINMKILKTEIKLYGAICCESIDLQTTHIILCSVPDNNDICEINDNIRLHKCKPVVVTKDWVLNCLKKKLLIDVDDHKLDIVNY